MDTVSLSKDLVIQNQSIGVASTAQGFNDVDGILGIGPVDLTSGMFPCTIISIPFNFVSFLRNCFGHFRCSYRYR